METQSITISGDDRVRRVLSAGAQSLFDAGIETARLDAEVILGHTLAMTREQLLLSSQLSLSGRQIRRYRELLNRRLRREPVAYITGRQEFWSLDFDVTPGVLIPRPETERLVEIILQRARELPDGEPLKILDIGTGSGAIAVSLAKELPASMIWATDVSGAALKIAGGNARRNGVADRIHFLRGDLFARVSEVPGRFDLIAANPPYIRTAEIDTLEPEVSLWEPRAALDGGVDGLQFYRRIAREAHDYLEPDGAVAVEIGAGRAKDVWRLFDEVDGYAGVKIFQDYAGRDRVIVAQMAGQSAKSI
jgi:release factor glutamine methyltransferase